MKTLNPKANYGRVLHALLAGRHISELDAKEFQVCEIRTPIHQARPFFEPAYILRWKWITSPVKHSRIKEYWLEPNPVTHFNTIKL